MPESLYKGKDEEGIVFGSRVTSWEGWPDDVREILRSWNRDRSLSFVYVRRVFQCPRCDRYIDNRSSTACFLLGEVICDDCAVSQARALSSNGA